MIIRFWLIASVLLVALAWVLMVPFSPPSFQASPTSSVADYRMQGLVPKQGEMTFSDAIGHDVFEVPEGDAEETAMATMPGMANMPGMSNEAEMPANMTAETGGEHGAEAGVAGTMPSMDKNMDMPADKADAMPESSDMANMPDKNKNMDVSNMESGSGMGANMGANMSADMGTTGEEGGHEGGMAGLRVLDTKMAGMAKRTIEIEMREWGFSPPSITVAMGEVVRLVVRNSGNVPHEFMLMPPQAMSAVAYRLDRADWNLTEHEAIFERQVVLPGDSFETIVQADRPGNWMYMCMFPYHMQFGMMGSFATEGAPAMEGMNMGGMKM
jgi:uncharacterized cupredoxin-like copper-binding protein